MAAPRRRGRGGDARRRTEPEFSCGGVVVHEGRCLVIVPWREDGRPVLALPKGHVEPGEAPPQAAVREVLEETAVACLVVGHLDDVVYWYQREGKRIRKTVRFFLCRYEGGEPRPDGDETVQARWMPLTEAARELAFPGDRSVVRLAAQRVGA